MGILAHVAYARHSFGTIASRIGRCFERQDQTLSLLEQSEYNQTQLVQEEMNQNEKQIPETNLPDINTDIGNPDENGYEFTA